MSLKVVALVVVVLAASAPVVWADWPQFLGPSRDGIVHDAEALPREWPTGGPKLAWKAEGIGYGYSSVTMANGLICTAGNIGNVGCDASKMAQSSIKTCSARKNI